MQAAVLHSTAVAVKMKWCTYVQHELRDPS